MRNSEFFHPDGRPKTFNERQRERTAETDAHYAAKIKAREVEVYGTFDERQKQRSIEDQVKREAAAELTPEYRSPYEQFILEAQDAADSALTKGEKAQHERRVKMWQKREREWFTEQTVDERRNALAADPDIAAARAEADQLLETFDPSERLAIVYARARIHSDRPDVAEYRLLIDEAKNRVRERLEAERDAKLADHETQSSEITELNRRIETL
jgi:hypothetical protein